MSKTEYDGVVVGSGPNGLAAAITMQQAGLSVLLIEAKDTPGGGLRSAALTLPHFVHDICSAIHPLAAGSPFFNALPLEAHGLEFVYPEIPAAHPLDDGKAVALYNSLKQTAENLGKDESTYIKTFAPLVENWDQLAADVLGPLHFPNHPLHLAAFGVKAITSAATFAKKFDDKRTKALWAGMAGHSLQDLSNLTSSAAALMLMTVGHVVGWPFPKGGANAIAKALANYFISLGGEIQTNFHVNSLRQLPSSKAVLLDVTPKQLLQIAGHKFSSFYKWQLRRYRYGMGVFKIDWALKEPIPFEASECRRAGTIHLGNTWEEIAASEAAASAGKHPERPFVLLAQQSLFDPSRAPEGKQVAWAYCHVPNGSGVDMTVQIESQVERFAPGFKDLILAKHTVRADEMELYNPNYIGGDINGGIMDARQLFTRPALRMSPYKTSAKGIYICSSSTPPGGGVHGMCGYHAAKRALKDIFKLKAMPLSKSLPQG